MTVSVGPSGALGMANDNALRARYRGGHPRSNLATVKLMGRKKGHDDDLEGGAVEAPALDPATSPEATSRGSGRTGPKGRPTPKRSQAGRNARKAPVAPAPMTASEARARRKTLSGPKLSREERSAERAASRARMTERRDRMMA